ncbi:MAG: biopolymer transporter ExbD [Pseudomonadota bacterium]
MRLAPSKKSRRPSLTPMIDVVFLLLVFFMLASRFGVEAALPFPLGGGAGDPPDRLLVIDVRPTELRINGTLTTQEELPNAILAFAPQPNQPLILRPKNGASVQDVLTIADLITQEKFSNLVLVE